MSEQRDVSPGESSLRRVTVAVATVCTLAQIQGLIAAFFYLPRFGRVYSELAIELPAMTGFALGYGLSWAFLALSIVALVVTAFSRGNLRIMAVLAAVLLPLLHVAAIFVSTWLPLLTIVETIGAD
jgi:hypothetical protein